jgi:hypothetical protein
MNVYEPQRRRQWPLHHPHIHSRLSDQSIKSIKCDATAEVTLCAVPLVVCLDISASDSTCTSTRVKHTEAVSISASDGGLFLLPFFVMAAGRLRQVLGEHLDTASCDYGALRGRHGGMVRSLSMARR